jgi:putative photosynthetic complex assembly protein 2
MVADMSSLWIAVAFAIFIWWFSTGLVLLLDNLPRTTFRWSLLLSSLLAVAALVGLAHTAQQQTLAGAYCAFTCALLVWGWHELTFLTGWITGPRRLALAPGVEGWPRFRAAVQAILWHELAILASGAVIVTLTWDAPNQVGTWTFGLLWVMRVSAKLNLFLGVRNLSEDFLPGHLAYMGSYFRRRRMNALLPWSVLGGAVGVVLLVRAALAPDVTPVAAVGHTLVATLLVLAVVEHLMLVLPMQPSALWRWAMRGGDGRGQRASILPVGAVVAPDKPFLPASQ